MLYSSYIKSKRKVKNLSSVTISQGYHVPNLHTYNEAMETISTLQAECTILLFFQNLDEIYHFGSDIRSSVYGVYQEPRFVYNFVNM